MNPDRYIMVATLLSLLVMLVAASAIMLLREARARELDDRVVKSMSGYGGQGSSGAGIVEWMCRFGEKFRRFYSASTIASLRSMIATSGFNQYRMLPLLLGGKVMLMVLLPIIGITASFLVGPIAVKLIVVGAGVVGGILGPEVILGFMRRRFVAALQRGTPDALDLLVVCSEAGMGLESGLERVAQEMQNSNRPTANVLSGLLDDLRVLPDRREAFVNFGTRSGSDGLRRFATMMAQTMQYGTPLSDALRSVAAELRRERMNKLEETAVKLPAKLIFPLIFFIMPSLYIVLLGPSFLHLYDALIGFAISVPTAGG